MSTQNHTVVAYIDKTSKEDILNGFQEMNLGEVIINGNPWNDLLDERPVAMFTFIKIENNTWNKIKSRKFFRELRTQGTVRAIN